MGDPKSGTRRRRAVGTRDRIISRLTAGEIKNEAGMASTVLATDVGYPGSSIAFAQLLSGMERSGLIEREVRGKRTYRIAAAPGALDGSVVASAGAAVPIGRKSTAKAPAASGRDSFQAAAAALDGTRHLATAAKGSAEFDYDELARRLLIQVVRQLATPGQPAAQEPGDDALEKTVAGLERELASVRTLHGNLRQENARLREQLRATRRSLALAQERPGGQQVADELDATEVNLLERLLAPAAPGTAAPHAPASRAPAAESRREDAETG
ncbi:MAG TPA: hypothetical protein VGI74_11485 [Streptosporangiaceae bacterium]|jgi:hypothetical protein